VFLINEDTYFGGNIMIMKIFPYKAMSILIVMCAFIGEAAAYQRCCFHHGGAMGCNERTGRYVCADGTLSRCRCERVYYIEEFDDFDGAYYFYHNHHHHHH
jgi:hypothetical protein